MNRTEFSTADLTRLQRQLIVWRRRQHGRTRLPEAVWESAATLARSQGVSLVSRQLRLDFYKLKRLAAQPQAGASNQSPPPSFVELALSPPESHGERGRGFRVELEAMGGHRMTVEVGGDVSALVALAQALWGRGS